jgi:hypothetical protein
MATNVARCPVGCVPDPYLFSKIYGIVKRGEEEKYMELFRTVPDEIDNQTNNDNKIVIVVLLLFCLFFVVAAVGGVYFFQDNIATKFGYKDGNDMFNSWKFTESETEDESKENSEEENNSEEEQNT